MLAVICDSEATFNYLNLFILNKVSPPRAASRWSNKFVSNDTGEIAISVQDGKYSPAWLLEGAVGGPFEVFSIVRGTEAGQWTEVFDN